jgi:hypothetical protein
MARFKKHGKELLRIEKEANVTAPEDSITWHKTTKTYHSDGAILSKYDVRFKPQPTHGGMHTELIEED